MTKKLHIFHGYGLELEYMVVDLKTLLVKPIVDELFHLVAGSYASDIKRGEMEWSNELTAHVVEFKNTAPMSDLKKIANQLQTQVEACNILLKKFDAQLLPSGAHPLMNPLKEAVLWRHGHNEVYQIYNQVFNCQGHGWSNVQSLHLNLPFYNDDEFGRLHAAIRLLLPIIPALSASTPIIEGKSTGLLDTRLDYYRKNQARVPSITGMVIPERVFEKKAYEKKIFAKIYHDIKPYDPLGILQHEWLNSRGAIARFERSAIEIRVIDMQECPLADAAIAAAIVGALKFLVSENGGSFSAQKKASEKELAELLFAVIKKGGKTRVNDAAYLRLFGYTKKTATVKELWRHILNNGAIDPVWQKPLETILTQGSLAERIQRALHKNYAHKNILAVYHQLAGCLQAGALFLPK